MAPPHIKVPQRGDTTALLATPSWATTTLKVEGMT
jgi:hypothetical protein